MNEFLKRLAKAIGFHVHEWGPWELVVMEAEDVVLTSGQSCHLVGRRFHLRQCKTCGKHQPSYSRQDTEMMRREMDED